MWIVFGFVLGIAIGYLGAGFREGYRLTMEQRKIIQDEVRKSLGVDKDADSSFPKEGLIFTIDENSPLH